MCKTHHVGSLCSMFRQKLFARLANPFWVCQARCWTKTFCLFFSGGLTYKCLSNIYSLRVITECSHIYSPRNTAISRKVVGKSARDNPERYCGWFWVHCSSKKFERMAGEAMDVCLRVLKESNKSRFDSYSVRNSELIVFHTTFLDCRVHIFYDNFPRNGCIREGNHAELYFAMTSGTVTRDWGKNRPIADRCAPRKNCGIHFGSSPLLVSNMTTCPQSAYFQNAIQLIQRTLMRVLPTK